MSNKFTSLEKELYKKLFDLFQQDQHHVDFVDTDYPDNYAEIVTALDNLDKGGVLIPIYRDEHCITVELYYTHCYKFQEL